MDNKLLEGNSSGIIITLKSIDPDVMVNKYRSGGYMSITIPSSKVIISGKRQNSLSLPGNDPLTDDTFIIRTNCKGSSTYATTNCIPYQSYTKTGIELLGGTCNWCGYVYKHHRRGIIKALIQDETTHNKLVAYWEGDSCGFGCMYAEAELWAGDPAYADEFNDAINNIKILFEKCYPGKTLIKAPPYFLFKPKGGSIDPEKYERHIFIPQNDIITVPIKRVFEMKKISDPEKPTVNKSQGNSDEEVVIKSTSKENKHKKITNKHKKASSDSES